MNIFRYEIEYSLDIFFKNGSNNGALKSIGFFMHIIFHATVEWSSFPFQNALWAIFIKKVCSNFNKSTSY